MGADIESIRGWVDSWATEPLLEGLVREWGGQPPTEDDLLSRLRVLEAFSERWDFRGGRERNLVDSVDVSAEQRELVEAAASKLGLVGVNDPPPGDYDQIVILGGLVRACVARPRHAARLLEDGRLTSAHVIALGGHRPLRGDEQQLAAALLPAGIDDEFSAMDAGTRAAFGLATPVTSRGERSDVVGASWSVREYRRRDALRVDVVAAPSSQPGVRRANTPDTYDWLARTSGWLRRGQRMLIVTTDIYRPYQRADAVRMLTLPHAIEVEVVGAAPGQFDPRLDQSFEPHQYLQEIRSGIRSMRLLLEAIDEAGEYA
jgi:hypothetical protein